MKLMQKISLGCTVVIFLFGLWMHSWIGPEEGEELEDDWPDPPPE